MEKEHVGKLQNIADFLDSLEVIYKDQGDTFIAQRDANDVEEHAEWLRDFIEKDEGKMPEEESKIWKEEHQLLGRVHDHLEDYRISIRGGSIENNELIDRVSADMSKLVRLSRKQDLVFVEPTYVDGLKRKDLITRTVTSLLYVTDIDGTLPQDQIDNAIETATNIVDKILEL